VMVCDDEMDLLYLFKSALEPAYDVLAVESGKGCIEKFVEERQPIRMSVMIKELEKALAVS
jgi:CheY-like chemotaxis protein